MMNLSGILDKIALANTQDNLKSLTELFYQEIKDLPIDEKTVFEKQYQIVVKQKITKITTQLNELAIDLDFIQAEKIS